MHKPRRLIHDKPPVAGCIKVRPEDFVVNELPLYEPCGEGEHLYMCVRKRGMSHETMTRLIADGMGVKPRAIGTAGRKDRIAVTTQLVSVHLPGEPDRIPNIQHEGIEVAWHDRHTNKLRTGHLIGNRFDIRIREIDPMKVTTLQKRLNVLAEQGLPNVFGTQRFGNEQNNHLLGAALVTNQFDKLVDLILAGDEKHHGAARGGDYKKAFDSWPLGNPVQRTVLEALVKGKSAQAACRRISKSMQKLWVNALQSWVFNLTLHRRLREGTWNTLQEGDLAWKHLGGGRTFEATAEDIATEELQHRVASMELSPTGPLWGPKMRMPTGKVLEGELADLEEGGVVDALQQNDRRLAAGARRPLRVPLNNASIGSGVDEHGGFVRVQFELPAGSYATAVVEEILAVPSVQFRDSPSTASP